MNGQEIDRLLRDDVRVSPSPDFASRVMRAVRREVRDREAIAFPWRRLAAGIGACALVTIAGVAGGARPIDASVVVERAMSLAPFTWMLALLAVTYLLVRWSGRLVA